MMFKKYQIIFILFCGTYYFSQTAIESKSQNYANLTQGAIYPYQFSITTLTSEMPKWNFSYSSSYGKRVNGPFGYECIGAIFNKRLTRKSVYITWHCYFRDNRWTNH